MPFFSFYAAVNSGERVVQDNVDSKMVFLASPTNSEETRTPLVQ